jgi:hypothetical protein
VVNVPQPSRRIETQMHQSKVLYSVRIPSETMHASQMVPRKIARGDAITTEAILSHINNRNHGVARGLQQTTRGKLLKHYEMVPI